MASRRRTTTRIAVDTERGVFMISVAAELSEMHPQTLRMYESRGLIQPKRSPKGTRLYSHADVERLRRIQEMTAELGLNLAGVERVLQMEQQLDRAARRIEALERRTEQIQTYMERELARLRGTSAEMVRYEEPGGELIPTRDLQAYRIEVQRGGRPQGPDGDVPGRRP
jgi:MerR family transcriptional regulator, heat shock protein HspR